jgi:hypothetical protein
MISSRILHALFAGIVVACCATAGATVTKEEQEVQLLGNFPALQKLSRDNGAMRKFLNRISGTYAEMGYDDFARELRRSGSMVVLFGQPERSAKSGTLKKARAALSRLKQALEDDRFVTLPSATNDAMPDYYGLAAAFLDAADIAVKNLSLGKNVANSLRNNKATIWITHNTGSNTFSLTGSFAPGVAFEFEMPVQTTYQATTGNYSFNPSSFSSTNLAASVTGSIQSFFSGSLTINAGGGFFYYSDLQEIALPPDLALPLDEDYQIVRVAGESENLVTESGTPLPAGTQIIRIRDTFVPPTGALIYNSSPNPYLIAVGSDAPRNPTAWGKGNRYFNSGSSLSPYRLVGAIVSVSTSIYRTWIAFPPDVTDLTTDFQESSFLLGRDYLADNISLAAGTRIAVINSGDPIPNGAVVLPASDFTLTPVPLSGE